jgi:hypothetical protein
MKIKEGYLIKEIASTYVIITIGKVADYSKITTLPNAASADVFQWIQDGKHIFNPDIETVEEFSKNSFVEFSFSELLDKLVAEYDVSRDIGEQDLRNFLLLLLEKNILEPDAELVNILNEQ